MNSIRIHVVRLFFLFFFFNDPATPEISPLSLHAPLPIPPSDASTSPESPSPTREVDTSSRATDPKPLTVAEVFPRRPLTTKSHRFTILREEVSRSEEHTSELQSQSNLVCRLLLEKKKKQT